MTMQNDLDNYATLGGGNEPCIAPGLHGVVISGEGATRTLLASESGATILMDRAAGQVYTLPTPVVGMKFRFCSTVTVTSNAYKVITQTPASEFIIGSIVSANATVAASGDIFTANGTSHVAISENGTTTGGVIGDDFTLEAISTTQWLITGRNSGSGTNATPFATS